MKIAIITLHAINNYGSVLQTLATEYLFEKLGCEVETIDYIRETAQCNTIWKILYYGGPGLELKIKQIILHFMHMNRKKGINRFDVFRNKYLHLTKTKYRSDRDLMERCPVADIYCTGSDQTWNIEIQHGVPRAFFLAFTPDNKKRIAFSSSFGISRLHNRYKAEVKELLSKYSAISVREKSGIDILNDLGFNDAVKVLDPTLVVGVKLWDSLAAPRMIAQDYILVYQLNRSRTFVKYVNEFANKKGLHVAYVRSRKERINNSTHFCDVTPEEFLSLFKYSSYVITDSFHATVFSLMFHCNFMVIYPPKYPTRLESVLQLTGLKSRHVRNFSCFDYADNHIDYDRVDSIIEIERQKSMDFLNKALN